MELATSVLPYCYAQLIFEKQKVGWGHGHLCISLIGLWDVGVAPKSGGEWKQGWSLTAINDWTSPASPVCHLSCTFDLTTLQNVYIHKQAILHTVWKGIFKKP